MNDTDHTTMDVSERMSLPVALTVAGSDSGGGAGIQADLKTFHQFGVFGTSAITAITAQNTTGVSAIHPVPLDDVRAQIDAVVSDLRPDAAKTGMLATVELVEVVASALRAHRVSALVVDPVMVATSGDRLLEKDAEAALRTYLLPLAHAVTPNLEEAEILTGREVRSVAQMSDAARALVDAGADAALVKGGHLEGDAVDLLWDGENERVWRHARVETPHTHGTGCTLSAAITAGLALGSPLMDTVDRAITFIARAIATAPGLGHGRGPVNHFASAE
ncbi:MAG: bifunctional hydroxymethylpyrimidine kinase/phosphomethylpyrimidine kinase [Gemmatimonadota bacterium]|nr:bifunctional hydroxymethylpyrimidine kinase/phosphomethylpyrimidine kinase [Gemmatimonadota bacterium]MDE3007051.1 bifunctional hydroxymethylpyrimidine kinase/phosphomethylpyrimidine kinase [Gemmatimonadota bacterium]MDE3013032.1 bifunctional hydroxymethylpyrimidine kinase/phosphomethylpyrimidine kinase [Gemmatimonadota bacterium]